MFSKAGCWRKTKIFVRVDEPFRTTVLRANYVHYNRYTVMLRPLLPEVVPWILIGNNKVKCINIQPLLHPIIMDATVATWPISHRGWAPKRATVKSALHISRASEKVTSPHQCLGLLSCSEHEQSSARGYVKTCCQLCNISTRLQTQSPTNHFCLPPRHLAGLRML